MDSSSKSYNDFNCSFGDNSINTFVEGEEEDFQNLTENPHLQFSEEDIPPPSKIARICTTPSQGMVMVPTTSQTSATSIPQLLDIIVPPFTSRKFNSKEQFMVEMESKVENIVMECITVLHLDPREYHPFYIIVYKFTTIGKQLGFIQSEEEVDSLWRKYDSFGVAQFEKWEESGGEHFEELSSEQYSPYLRCILSNNSNSVVFNDQLICLKDQSKDKSRYNKYYWLDSIIRKHRRDWRVAGVSDQEIRDNLRYRLAFFQHVKKLTYPGDTVKMNKRWNNLINGYKKEEGGEGRRGTDGRDAQDKVETNFEEKPFLMVKRSGRKRKPPSRFELKDIATSGKMWSSKVANTKPRTKELIYKAEEGKTEEGVREVVISIEKETVEPKITPTEIKKMVNKKITMKKKSAKRKYGVKQEVITDLKNWKPSDGQVNNGGECPFCNKLLNSNLARHVREVHQNVSLNKKEVKEQRNSTDEDQGECPYCHELVKKGFKYHMTYFHIVTQDGTVLSRKDRAEIQNMTPEQRKQYQKEWQRLRRIHRTEEEKAEASRRLRERYNKKISSMTPEELEEFRRKNRFVAFEKRVQRVNLPEEEKERLKTVKFLQTQAWLSRKDKEWRDAQEQKRRQKMKEKRERMTAEQRELERMKHKEYRHSLTGEKLKRYRECVKRSVTKYFAKLKAENPEEYYNRTRGRWGKFLDYQRKRTESETPEHRQARLLRYRINQAKRRAREELLREGATQEEIEDKLEEVEEKVRSHPIPGGLSEYKPRLGARKPHKKTGPRGPRKQLENPIVKHDTQTVQAEATTPPHLEIEQSSNAHPLLRQQDPEYVSVVHAVILAPVIQQPVAPPAPPTLYTTFREISTSFAIQFDTTPTLTLVECTEIPENGASGISVISTSNANAHSYNNNPSSPMSCGGGNFGDENSCDYSATFQNDAEYTTVATVVEEIAPQSAPSLLAEPSIQQMPFTSVNTSVTSQEPQLQISLEEMIREQVVGEPGCMKFVDIPLLDTRDPPSRQASICDECGKTFTTQFSVQLHKNIMHAVDPSVLVCPECEHHCTSTTSLWNHFATHHIDHVDLLPEDLFPSKRKPSVRGPHCPYKEPYKQVRSDPNNPHFCDLCGKSFVQKCTLDDHIRRVHEGKGYYCDVCGRDQQSSAKLWRHKVERHGMSDLPPPIGVPAVRCKYCDEIVMRGYEQHVKKRHPEQQEDFRNWYNPEAGTAPRKFLDNKVKCPHCPSIVKEKLLNRHIKHVHDVGPKHPCPGCGFQFKRIDHMKKHFRDHHAVADIEKKLEAKQLIKIVSFRNFTAKCLLCNEDIASKVILRAHFVKEHHQVFQECQIASIPIFECAFCEEKFCKETQLQSHISTSHSDKVFTCQHCGVIKYSQSELSTHERMHQHQERSKMRKQGKCTICNFEATCPKLEDMEGKPRGKTRQLYLEVLLKEHVKSEHPEKYFPCPNPQCGLFCTSQEGLHNHLGRCQKNGEIKVKEFVNKEVDKLPVYCPECRGVYKLYQLGKHLKAIHGKGENERYPCDKCAPRIFRCRRYFVAHMHLVHNVPYSELIDLAPDDAVIVPRKRRGRQKRLKNENQSATENVGAGRPKRRRKVEEKDDEALDMGVSSDDEEEWTEEIGDRGDDDCARNLGNNGVAVEPSRKSARICEKKQVMIRRKRKIGPKSRTQGRKAYLRSGSLSMTTSVTRGRNPCGDDNVEGDLEVEKGKRLMIQVERMSDDLFKFYVARRLIVKVEPEC